jgi:hypothetical protein
MMENMIETSWDEYDLHMQKSGQWMTEDQYHDYRDAMNAHYEMLAAAYSYENDYNMGC